MFSVIFSWVKAKQNSKVKAAIKPENKRNQIFSRESWLKPGDFLRLKLLCSIPYSPYLLNTNIGMYLMG